MSYETEEKCYVFDTQRALAEWRHGRSNDSSSSSTPKQTRDAMKPTPAAARARPKSAGDTQYYRVFLFLPKFTTLLNNWCVFFVVVAMTHESSTGTETEPFKSPPIEIRFKSSLTYAEKLMLKRARRTELGTAVRGLYKHVCFFVYIM